MVLNLTAVTSPAPSQATGADAGAGAKGDGNAAAWAAAMIQAQAEPAAAEVAPMRGAVRTAQGAKNGRHSGDADDSER